MDYLTPPNPPLTSTSARLPIPLMQLGHAAFHYITSLNNQPMRQNEDYFVEEVFRDNMTFGLDALATIAYLSQEQRAKYRDDYHVIMKPLPPFMEREEVNRRAYVSMARGLAFFLETLRDTYPHIQGYMEEIPDGLSLLDMLNNPYYVLNTSSLWEFGNNVLVPEKERLRHWRIQKHKEVGQHPDMGKTLQKTHLLIGLSEICGIFPFFQDFGREFIDASCLWEGVRICLQVIQNRDTCLTTNAWNEAFIQDTKGQPFEAFFDAWAAAIKTVILNTFDDDALHVPRLL